MLLQANRQLTLRHCYIICEGSHNVLVSALDSESSNLSSNLDETPIVFFFVAKGAGEGRGGGGGETYH